MLVFDEIKLKPDLAYSKPTEKLIRYTYLGPISNDLEPLESRLNAAQDSEDTGPEGTSSAHSDTGQFQVTVFSRFCYVLLCNHEYILCLNNRQAKDYITRCNETERKL